MVPEMIYDEKKICAKCLKEKDILDFHKNIKNPDGLHYYCKECRLEYAKQERIIRPISYERERNNRRNNLGRYAGYAKEKRNTDINYRLASALRSRIWKAIKTNSKSAGTVELLGCSIRELKLHLESFFKRGMTWENYGTFWHIDHVMACSKFDLSIPAHQKQCFHWKNLRPLKAIDNLSKGKKITNPQLSLIL